MFHSPAETACDHVLADFVGRADPRAAAFAGVIERVLVHFLGRSVVDDVTPLEPSYWLRSQVSIQNDSVRTISFCSSVIEPRDVHHVDDDRIG
jgi:hypothetical protein